MNLVDAINREEGFGANASNLPTRNNNPGNIVYGSFAASYGATKDPTSDFAVFPNSEIGLQAETDLLSSSNYSGLTISQAISKWNGQGANTPSYIANVASWTGLDLSTTVADALGTPGTSVSDIIANSTDDNPIGNWFDYAADSGSVNNVFSSSVSDPGIETLALAGAALLLVWMVFK